MQRDAVTRVCTYPIDAFDLNASRLDWTDRWIRPVVTTDTSHEGKKGIHFLRCLPWSTLLQRRFPPRHLLPSVSQSGGEIFCFVRDRSSLNKQTNRRGARDGGGVSHNNLPRNPQVVAAWHGAASRVGLVVKRPVPLLFLLPGKRKKKGGKDYSAVLTRKKTHRLLRLGTALRHVWGWW
jgi:hypothetical protein